MGFWKKLSDRIRNIFRRGYDAVDDIRRNRNWLVRNEPAELTNRYSRDDLRAKARDLEMNSDLTNAVIAARERNIIGSGFTLQAHTPNARINSLIEGLWSKWCKPRNCDVTGVQSLHGLMRMAVRRKLVDGGVLIHKCYTPHGPVPLSLQMLEVDSLDTSQISPLDSDNEVAGGIEYDSYNRAVAYWFKQYSVNGITNYESIRVEAKDVIFYFDKTRPTQVREVSGLAPLLMSIRDANQFVSAVAVKQRIEACLSVFIKRVQGNANAGRNVTRRDGKVNYEEVELGPGLIQDLNAGDEIQVVNPTGQATDASQFLKMLQRAIASGIGLSYEAVTRDLSQTNYSSARQGAIEDEIAYAAEREQIELVMDEIYETFIISACMSGQLGIDIEDLLINKDKWFEHEWVRRPKPWIDPYKEASANQIALRSGQKTFATICAEQGMDWHDVIDSYAELVRYADKKGIDVSTLLFDGALTTSAKEVVQVARQQGEQQEQPVTS